ncbi:MAG: hypothetical protein HQL54_02005 [Magnetococcales bacterium]|nr:hypothetical protein [Magnetococcales bacterium]
MATMHFQNSMEQTSLYGDGLTSDSYIQHLRSRFKKRPKAKAEYKMPLRKSQVPSNPLQKLCERLYGFGMMPKVYIRALARDLNTQESMVAQWWNAGNGFLPQAAIDLLDNIQYQRRRR